MFKIALLCGGPSLERGISLNSARSVMDHLSGKEIKIVSIYVDAHLNFFEISPSQLYSNTPLDFDFKLATTAISLNEEELKKILKKCNIVFSVIHGTFGEDGQIQKLLEELKIPFIGSNSVSCKKMFHKYFSSQELKKIGFKTIPSLLLSKQNPNFDSDIRTFFSEKGLKKGVLKPCLSGSSLGVSIVKDSNQAIEKTKELISLGHSEVLLEPFLEGREFTIVVLETPQGKPVALIPTEIRMKKGSGEILDYRKKYLPTNQVFYHTPPLFSSEIISEIRVQAETIFTHFGMHDFVRIDGWLFDDGSISFTDINPISGMEQNSFLFRQTAVVGLTHQQTLKYILNSSLARQKILFNFSNEENRSSKKQPVFVIFGGGNAERQVSLMSGTNVWLKLKRSNFFSPIPYFYDTKRTFWQLPYSYTLNHTIEEIESCCNDSTSLSEDVRNIIRKIQTELNINQVEEKHPEGLSINEFLELAKSSKAFVFIGMHGGEGENGTFQKLFENYDIPYNGSNSHSSKLCMDKYETGKKIEELNHSCIFSLSKKIFNVKEVIHFSDQDYEEFWFSIISELKCNSLIIKPRSDGCSAGIVILRSVSDFKLYLHHLNLGSSWIPANSFSNQSSIIEMPSEPTDEYIIEPYIETDVIKIIDKTIHHHPLNHWIELTVGVLEEKGHYHALNPSITIAECGVLSLEEKFQGGTGINLTPPPESIISKQATQKIRHLIEQVAAGLNIQNYARIDIFFNTQSEKMIVIEANSLPGLTPSTVIYHQGLAEEPPLYPTQFLEKLITSKQSTKKYKY